MKWIIAVSFITHLNHAGHAELEGRFDTKAQCENFAIMVTSIYQARFKSVTLECKRENEETA